MIPSVATGQGDILSTVEQIQNEFDSVPCKKQERLPAVRALFEKMGAKTEDIQSQKTNGVENFVVRRSTNPPGLDTIIIGAHYDFLGGGCGAIDNWTGIVTLAHLYRTIGKLSPRKNILFVAFDREEQGLVGSSAMARAIKKEEISHYCAMINLDSFGLAVPFALANVSSPSMIRLSEEVADQINVPFVTATIPSADADSSSFVRRNIPAITLSGLSNDWDSILHSKKDQAGKIQPASVYFGYRIALSMWGRIDEAPCDAFAASRK
jgi:Iap family predicted aminopeptidase